MSNYWQRIKSDPVKLGHYKEWRKQYVNNKKEIAFIAIGLLSLFLGCSECNHKHWISVNCRHCIRESFECHHDTRR